MLANMALAKGHSSKTKFQVSNIRSIGPLVVRLMHKLYKIIFIFISLVILNIFNVKTKRLPEQHLKPIGSQNGLSDE